MATTLSDINNLINDRRRDSGSYSINMTTDGFRAINSTLNLWNQFHEWEFQIEKYKFNYNKGCSFYNVPRSGTVSIFKAPLSLNYFKNPSTKSFDIVSDSSFDQQTLTTNRYSINTRGQTDRLRINAVGDKMDIDTASALTSNGTWVGTGAISSVATDSYESWEQAASVSFNFSGTTGVLTKTLTNSIDLTPYVNRSTIYWNVDSTVWTNWTSMTLKLGSDASNYYTASVTSDYLDDTPDDWSKFKIAWSSLTSVGSPDYSAIDYIELQIDFSSNPSAVMRIENFFISEDVPLLLEHYSTYMVTDSGTKSQVFTDSSDTGDNPLWSGKWDWVTEAFVNSVLEIIFWMTGEYDDMMKAETNILKIVENLKKKLPSRRKYPEMLMKFDIN